MANKSPGKRETKKPKKEVKINTALKEMPSPISVDVVPKKRKDRVEED